MARYILRSYSDHAFHRFIARGIMPEDISRALEHPDRFYKGKGGTVVGEIDLTDKLCLRVIYTENSLGSQGIHAHVITAYKLDRKRAERQAANENS